MSSIDEQVANQIANIERSTGRSFNDWVAIVHAFGIEKHGQAVAKLKAEHGLGHGNANLIVSRAREALTGSQMSDDALIESHYTGRNAHLRAVYDAIAVAVRAFGSDVELAPKKTYVSIRRTKQFAQVGPAAGQLEIGLNLPGRDATDRLKPMKGMATHRVRIANGSGVDGELIGWLREAYGRA